MLCVLCVSAVVDIKQFVNILALGTKGCTQIRIWNIYKFAPDPICPFWNRGQYGLFVHAPRLSRFSASRSFSRYGVNHVTNRNWWNRMKRTNEAKGENGRKKKQEGIGTTATCGKMQFAWLKWLCAASEIVCSFEPMHNHMQIHSACQRPTNTFRTVCACELCVDERKKNNENQNQTYFST